MIAANPTIIESILDALGWLLARLYDLIPNYGVAIILFTLGIRLLLLPLGVKQIRSMQATAVMQPKIKAIQQKYKQDRQRQQEEMMKLYREYGYNPLSGCLPLLLQLPVLIALFAVLKFPTGLGHIPQDSKLYAAIARQDTHFLGTNLLCSAVQAGNPKVPAPAPPKGSNIELSSSTLNCGNGAASRIPYYAFAIAMIATTYFQQRQMQKSSPAGQNPQQQTIMRVMPLLFGVWGFIFPTGLVVYWTTTNVVQIGQQYFLIHRRGAPLAPPAQEIEPRAGKGGGKGAPAARQGKGGAQTKGTKGSMRPAPKQVRGTSSFGGRRGGVSRGQANGGGKRGGGPRPGPGGNGGTPGRDRRGTGGSGARDARDRKKRPDR